MVIPTKQEAKEYLSQRIVNEHVIDTCYDLGVIAAERHGVPTNKFFWLHGLQKTLESFDKKQEQFLDIKYDDEVDGETIHLGDLYGIWDFSISWREEIDFQQFLALRYICKTDALQLGWILAKDFHELPGGPHGEWSRFYPRLKPTLRPGYDQEQMKVWLAAQDPVKDRLLMASRNAYKSSWNVVWLLTAVLCCPDIRLLLVSETNKLSKGFIRGFRNYFEVANKRQPTRFQQLFPEHTIPPGDGSVLSFESPMRSLNLIQFTAEATSMESTVAGQRADIIVFDDPISDKNTGTEDTRQKGVDTFDSTQKLREVGGYTILIGTPWHVEDLYATLIRRTNADEQTDSTERMAFRVDPAWIVKREARHKKLRDLQEQDVVLLFPSRLDWKFLQKELRNNETFFRSQNLCEFVSEDDQTKVTFLEEDLRARVKLSSFFERSRKVRTILTVDPSFSKSRFADFSALAVLDIIEHENRTVCYVRDVRLERLKQSELGKTVVDMIGLHNCNGAVIEKTGPWEDLQGHINAYANQRELWLPHVHFEDTGGYGPGVNAKTARIKGLETLLAENRLYFAPAGWNEQVFQQFIKFDGVHRSNNTRKDDAPDAIALGCKRFLPRFEASISNALQEEEAERRRQEEYRQAVYNRTFGTQQLPENFVSRYQTPEESKNRLYSLLGQHGYTRKAS